MGVSPLSRVARLGSRTKSVACVGVAAIVATAAAASATATAGTAAGVAGVSADPAGSVTLASGLGVYGERYGATAHTSRGTLISFEDRRILVSDTGVASSVEMALEQANDASGCADIVAGQESDETGVHIVWLNVVTGATGSRPLSDARQHVGPTATGWLEVERPLEGVVAKVYAVNAATGSETLVGSFTEPDETTSPPEVGHGVCDAAGVAFDVTYTDHAEVVRGLVSGGTQVVTSAMNTATTTPGFEALAVAGTTVAYRHAVRNNETWEETQTTQRKAVGGSPESLWSGSYPVARVAITASDSFIAVASSTRGVTDYFRKPVGGASVAVSGVTSEPDLLAPTATGFVAAGGAGPSDGVYGVSGTTATRLWKADRRHMQTYDAVAAPGRAVWTDDRRTDSPLWSRTLTGTSSLAAGPESLIGTHVSGSTFAVSGRRTAWTNDQSGKLVVHNGASASTRSDLGLTLGMSAHRVLRMTVLGDASVVNLVTGASMPAAGIRDIWGNTGVGLNDAESIIKQDLVTGARSVLLTKAQAGGTANDSINDVAIDEDLVIWTRATQGPTGTSATHIGWRNLRTGSQGNYTVGDDNVYLMSPDVRGAIVGAGYWGETMSGLLVNTTTGSALPRITGTSVGGAVRPGASGVAWSTATGAAKASPLPAQHLRPRHEGNAFAPTTFNAANGATAPWRGEWVFTEALTTCSVAIKNAAGTTVRTLGCQSNYAKLGEAVVAWDGKDATGAPVHPGAYTWRVVAGDADGAAFDVNGVSTTISGPISVSGVAPIAYTALPPTRLIDTRTTAVVPPGGHVSVQVAGRGGAPFTGVGAAVLNVTAVSPTAAGHLVAWPSGAARPTASNVNYATGSTIANQVIAKVGADGKVNVYSSAKSHVLVDLAGYYPPGANYTALAPSRLLDTRSTVRIPAGGKVDLLVAGRGGVPGSGAAAVTLNVTAVSPAGAGHLTVWPAGAAQPNSSNVNYAAGQNIAGLTVAKLGSGGKISIYSSTSSDVIVDVSGWFPATSDYTALTPARLLDTRVPIGGTRPAAGGTVALQVLGRGSVPATGVKAVLLNVTQVASPAAGHVTVYASGTSRPSTSTLNYGSGTTIANSVLVKVGADGKVLLYSSSGGNLIADVQGYVKS